MRMENATAETKRKSRSLLNVDRLRKIANTVRGLAIDAIQRANSGHPGLPLGMADAAVVLWMHHLKHHPGDPEWPDRDRFVLSAGHGSMLLYALLHLFGYDLSLEELKRFRQLDSKTPGHPEFGHTPGVETTTGPLGQGIANAVGMAIAEKWLAAKYNTKEFTLFDHYTYVIASDGDLMEGISHEACSLAGHLGLGKLIVLYDDNAISIDGSTELAFTEDTLKRFRAYGWHVQRVDGHDMQAVDEAITRAKRCTGQPSLIACRTVIGFGSPNRAGTAKVHGEPLGEEEARLTKARLGLPVDRAFHIPDEVQRECEGAKERGVLQHSRWQEILELYSRAYPGLYEELLQILARKLPPDWDDDLPDFAGQSVMATRAASGAVIQAVARKIPDLVGGSADLSGSNNTLIKGEPAISRHRFNGRYIHFGVREHAMGAILNGLSLHRGVRPYAGTFLVFSDYMRPAIRLAAMMKQPVIYVFTHDSIGLGEDGPTHQPVEHLSSLRLIPNLLTIRPADAIETVEAWRVALQRMDGPTALILTRQKLPVLQREKQGYGSARLLKYGGYILSDCEEKTPEIILMASGSEVHIALQAKRLLQQEGRQVRVVSMPSPELFLRQSEDYRRHVLPQESRIRIAIEAGATPFWRQLVGEQGKILGLDRFGASAPYQRLYEAFGFTAENVVELVRSF